MCLDWTWGFGREVFSVYVQKGDDYLHVWWPKVGESCV